MQPGIDMLTVVKEAKKAKAKIALIDQDIRLTLRNFSKSITWKERFRFIGDIFLGIFRGKKLAKEMGISTLDLNKVPSNKIIKTLINKLKKRYPSVYKASIDDRNKVMANNLNHILSKHPDETVVAVVGAGHVDGMKKLLDKPQYSYSYNFN